MLTRVSNIEAHRRWLNWEPRFDGDEEPSLDDLVRLITKDEPTEAMMAGTAFHAALEKAQHGEHTAFEANGYRFTLPDAEIELAEIRELRASKAYGDLIVSGKVDCLDGTVIVDHKTTSKVDLERYLEGCQWRFYLDIFEAQTFRWNVFEIHETAPREYRVSAPHVLTMSRYPGLHDDCAALAADYLRFARENNLPDAELD